MTDTRPTAEQIQAATDALNAQDRGDPASEIRTAINTLSAAHGGVVAGAWTTTFGWGSGWRVVRTLTSRGGLIDVVAEGLSQAEAELMVILYRTVTQQLLLLQAGADAIVDREALGSSYEWDDGQWSYNTSDELVAVGLARAINRTAE